MNEENDSQVCERAEDLISFLYGELGELEARTFERHRQNCRTCNAEISAFGSVQQSILAWRNQSLDLVFQNPVIPNQVSAFGPQRERSAMAAIRDFFALSPWWMKGATAVATLLFCVLAGLAMARLGENPSPGDLTQAEIERRIAAEVNRRVALEMAAFTEKNVDSEVTKPVQPPKPAIAQARRDKQGNPRIPASQIMRKPLTRAEREQLAADLRLVLEEDEDSLQLIGDRINR